MDPETVKKAGEPWIAEYERKISERNMEEYWAKQHGNPKNNRGNLFDAFAEIVLPRTLSEEELQELAATMEPPEEDPKNALFPQQVPGCLYEYMLKTVVPFGIRGILWYQGESDDVPGLNLLYKDMLTGLIADWRKLWKEKLPFLFVQLPGFDTWLWNSPVNEFSIIRRCQEEVADTVEGAYMCSISDAGEERDIHPKDKKTVGERLSLLARHYVYGEDILCDAPRAEQIVREGSRITITFANAGEGLYISGDRLTALSVTAGEKELSWTAAVQGNQLIIELSKEDAEEKEVRTAFARTGWYLVNLYNSAGIPAVPFEFQVVK